MTDAELEARLEAAAPVRAVRAALAEAGVPAWLVGGVVRDALLGRHLTDVDVVVAGDPEQTAKLLSRALGGPAFALSAEFGAWRTLDRARQATYDVSALHGGSIEADLARRDFTVNAIAVPAAGGAPIDPHGGRDDLEHGVLRVLGPDAYEADPLRPLRLVRLAAELGLVPDPETKRLTAAAAPRLSEPSGERVFAELRRLLLAPGALAGIELAQCLGVLAAILPEITALEGVEQSHFHDRDVYDHTIEVLRQLVELVPGGLAEVFGEHAPRVHAVLDEPLADELTRGSALRFGALFHDVAKPLTRGVRDDGRVTFIGHDRAGEAMVDDVFRRLRTSQRLRAYVGSLTRHHLRLGFLVHERPLTPDAVFDYLDGCDPLGVEVTVLSVADRLATRGSDADPAIAAHVELARELIGPALDWRERGRPRSPLDGDELTAELGIAPGPEVGELIAALERAAFTGEAATREAALALARELRDDRQRG